jgi:hypothetical protein
MAIQSLHIQNDNFMKPNALGERAASILIVFGRFDAMRTGGKR